MTLGEFIALMAMLMALVAFAINMILPSFRIISEDLGLQNENSVHLIVSLLYLGLALGQVIYGPLSDSIGRKLALSFGLALFLSGCCISFFANNFTLLVIGQIVQGIGLGSPRSVTLAIVRDNFEGDKMGRVMSLIMIVFILVPTISPALGQVVIQISSWRTIFLVLIILSLIMLLWVKLRLPETLIPTRRAAFSFKKLYGDVIEVVKNKQSFGYTVTLGLVSSSFLGYLNLSQQVFQLKYELGERYPIVFAVLSLSLGAALLLNSQLVVKYGMHLMSKWALYINSTGAAVYTFVVLANSGHPPFWSLMAFMMVSLFCFGILVGNLNSMAMKPLGHIAGTAAAIVGSLATLISVPFSILIGNSYSGSLLPLVAGFAIFGILGLITFTTLARRINS